ncbi:normal mucosa of esophagus-specific gene 1 protein-like [Limulus polyphemus]|uniref:Normal mucosa of esophagus-specific gene 1 protein-like n=1 Tax=Limulus polyphemus TaxID=6850 RepID=A0ABM1C5N2_LIMPO|nr:normal mucosa of esophagus-specific gene 1 protein-like [Limulus polyphemus]
MSVPGDKSSPIPHSQVKTFGFGFRAMRNKPEIIPLVTILTTACVGVAAYCVYALSQKSDVIINRKKLPPWERVDPETPQKLFTVHQEYKKIPELEALKKEIGSS